MRKAALLLLLVLIIPAPAFAQAPQLASSASIVVEESGTITALGGQMKDLELNLSVPISNEHQLVQGAEGAFFDSEGNPYIRISEPAPPNPFRYARSISVQTSERATSSLPASYVVPAEYAQFYSATYRTQSDDAQIRELALQITQNATEPFEKVALLAMWVNRHLTYDASLVGQEKDAAWALSSRRGVCVEYSTLFAAFARSLGIPVKYVTGYSYSPKFESWLGHAWAEAYIGKWVPVDSTWLEVGSLDALHIEEAKITELKKEYALTAYVSPPDAEVTWDAEGRSGAFAGNIRTMEVLYAKPRADFELRAVEDELAPGGKTLVYLRMEGSDYRVVQVILLPCSGEESVRVENQEQYLILRPGKTAVAVWEISAASDLPSNYVYACPLTLNSPLLENRQATITIDPRVKSPGSFSASLEKKNVQPGEENSVILTLPPDRLNKDYFVLTPSGGFGGRIAAAADSIAFTGESAPGTRYVYVAGEGGGYYRLDYEVGSKSGISIESFSVQGELQQGEPAYAVATVSSQSYPAEVELEFSFWGKSEKASATISAATEFRIGFIPDRAGAATATLVARSAGAEDEKSIVVGVAEQKTEEPEAPVQHVNETPAAPPQQQSCPLPLAILTVAFLGIAIRR